MKKKLKTLEIIPCTLESQISDLLDECEFHRKKMEKYNMHIYGIYFNSNWPSDCLVAKKLIEKGSKLYRIVIRQGSRFAIPVEPGNFGQCTWVAPKEMDIRDIEKSITKWMENIL